MKYLKILTLVSLVILSACATSPSSQPGHVSTMDADKYAAAVEVTYNCATCTEEQKEQILRALSRTYIQDTDKNWYQKTKDDLGETTTWRLNRALDQALFLILQDY